jgi:hypothetical protein
VLLIVNYKNLLHPDHFFKRYCFYLYPTKAHSKSDSRVLGHLYIKQQNSINVAGIRICLVVFRFIQNSYVRKEYCTDLEYYMDFSMSVIMVTKKITLSTLAVTVALYLPSNICYIKNKYKFLLI